MSNQDKKGTVRLPVTLKDNPRALKLTARKKEQFLKALAERWNVTSAAASIGVTRQAIYNLIKNDPDFKAAFNAVKDMYLDQCEQILIDFAATGKNITSNIFLLKTQRPTEWNDRYDLTVSHEIKFDPSELKNILNRIAPRKIIDAKYEDIDK